MVFVHRSMKNMGRPKAPLTLSKSETETLKGWVRRRKTHAALSLRAKIVLRCATGIDNIDVAEDLGISNLTVGKWRKRFIDRRLAGLLDEPRVGRPRTISDEEVVRVIDTTLR